MLVCQRLWQGHTHSRFYCYRVCSPSGCRRAGDSLGCHPCPEISSWKDKAELDLDFINYTIALVLFHNLLHFDITILNIILNSNIKKLLNPIKIHRNTIDLQTFESE
jgi:hypothetical protein